MTRDQVEVEYRVVSGIIVSRGKFELEPVYAPHYWEMGLEGTADKDDGDTYTFRIDASDVEAWPELAGVKILRLHADDRGFVHVFKEPL